MRVELIAVTRYLRGNGTPEELLEHAGRVCYRSKSKGDPGRFLRARIREGHESLIEHASATFEISGISRACSHQLVRHRLASYSQESLRYVDASNAEFVAPAAISGNPEALAIWDDFTERAREVYRALRQLGIRKEDARFLLPQATSTRIVVTMNFRELLHVFKLRISPQAQWEIREVCVRMLELVYPIAPNVFGDLREELRTKYPYFFEPGSARSVPSSSSSSRHLMGNAESLSYSDRTTDANEKPSRPSLDAYFMQIACVVSSRSTCLHRHVGAVIVKGKQIVSTGYNGAPAGHPHCLDIGCAREGVPSGQRSELCRGAHAEQNAINFAARYGISIEGATLYTTHYPCSWCAKSIINAGIIRVVYAEDYPDPLAKEILSSIQVEQFREQ